MTAERHEVAASSSSSIMMNGREEDLAMTLLNSPDIKVAAAAQRIFGLTTAASLSNKGESGDSANPAPPRGTLDTLAAVAAPAVSAANDNDDDNHCGEDARSVSPSTQGDCSTVPMDFHPSTTACLVGGAAALASLSGTTTSCNNTNASNFPTVLQQSPPLVVGPTKDFSTTTTTTMTMTPAQESFIPTTHESTAAAVAAAAALVSPGRGSSGRKKHATTERLQRSRERNRMHARKTRQRKKEHMQTLQSRADELKEEQIRLKQAINEKNTARILLGMFSPSPETTAMASSDSKVEALLKRSAEEIPDASKIPELPALILPGQHQWRKQQQQHADEAAAAAPTAGGDDGIDYELLGKDRSKCTPAELDQIRRERNRMHAKRTRDRKRIFMEEMAEMIAQLESENETLRLHLHEVTCQQESSNSIGGGAKQDADMIVHKIAAEPGVVESHSCSLTGTVASVPPLMATVTTTTTTPSETAVPALVEGSRVDDTNDEQVTTSPVSVLATTTTTTPTMILSSPPKVSLEAGATTVAGTNELTAATAGRSAVPATALPPKKRPRLESSSPTTSTDVASSTTVLAVPTSIAL